MTLREIVLAQINHQETERIPYTLPFEESVGERLDEHFGSSAWRDQLVPYVATCGSIHSKGREPVDETHNRDAFGTIWRTDEIPSVVSEPGLKEPSFDNYAFPSVDGFADPEALANIPAAVAEASERFTIVHTGMCLWQAWYVRGFEQTMMDCVLEEDFYAELLDRMTDLTLAFIDRCADFECDALMMGDDWGTQRGVMLGPERWRKLFKPRYARIFDAIHAQGKLAIMHCCGSAADIMGDIVEIGLDVLESVQPEAAGMNPYGLKELWGDKITFWGGLGSQHTIPFGTPDEIREEIRHLRSAMGTGGGYILAPAKPLRPETPTENAVAVVEEFLAG
jgi:uroporphyrinogen decarboxylase